MSEGARKVTRDSWAIGEEVEFLTGGPRMLVVDFEDDGRVVVAWSTFGVVEEASLDPLLLVEWESRE